ncbi:helix-turn-helix domain-containing protein [Brevibacillus choshinensis]|uniref:Helix-turn-helix domain-containing protein n=1 Tax=Brevibacillus choshinensis TaxID=54911 RepID=A0ABX7FJN3_BRECH|nr:helix-turn-helix domain-containing protein [Brevibacillus choshinensis]QRG66418.1 helix-turn-helix domain-containing protein [Brevibacillus choshinensis]
MSTGVIKQLQSFLLEKGLAWSGHIWQCKPHHQEFEHVARIGLAGAAGEKQPPLARSRRARKKPYYEVVSIPNQGSQMIFDYPQGYKVALMLKNPDLVLERGDGNYLYQLFYQLYWEGVVQERENELAKMVGGIRAITSSLDLDSLLQEILDNAIEVIPAADTGILAMYDPATDRLINRAAVGLNDNVLRYRLKVGEAIVGKTFADGQPRIYFTREEITEAMSNMERENLQYLLASYDFSHVKGTISIPISVGDKPIGAMIIHQNHTEGTLSERDVHLLKGFAGQAAVVIENARLFAELKGQNQYLSKRNEVHETLTRLSLENKGMEAIVAALDQIIGVPLLFVDFLEGNWYSRMQTAMPVFTMDEISRLFARKQAPVIVRMSGEESCEYHVTPLVVGHVFLGCLIAILDKPLDELGRIALEQGGAVLALELVKKQSLTDVYYKKTHEFFRELVETSDPELLRMGGEEWEMRLTDYMTVCVFSLRHSHDLRHLEAEVHRLIARIKRKLGLRRHLIFGYHNKVTLLAMLSSKADVDAFCQRITDEVKEWGDSEGLPLCAGIGTAGLGVGAIKKSHEEAQKALRYITERQQSGTQRYEELGINRLFLNQPAEELMVFLEEMFTPLRTEKARQNDLERTLLTFMATNSSAIRTAEQLHIHINTLYKRLKKIEQLLQLSFEMPEDVLKMQLACHLRETFVNKIKEGL